MIPLKEEEHLDAPTRLVRQATTTDGFRKRVFYDEEAKVFFSIDYDTAPKLYAWVVTGFDKRGKPIIEPYEGQDFVGVVAVLDFVGLMQSEQE